MSSSHTGQHASDPYEPRDHPGLTHRDADWAGLRVLVAGLGVSGFAAADALADRGAQVTAVTADATDAIRERAHILDILDVDVRIGAEHLVTVPEGTELVVTSPGLRPDHPLLVAAAAAGIPVWGEVELAWRMRPRVGAAPWITVTGTNGKTTTVNMLASILRAAGLRATSAGNVGTPLLEAVLHPEPYDVLAVELSSFQLHWQRSVAPVASACLNVAPDHVDWHGSLEDYRLAKGRVYQNTEIACVYNVQDPVTEQLVMDADVVEGCRAIGFTLGVPGLSMVGLVDDVLADRAFVEQRRTSAAELATLADLQGDAPSVAPHYVANALAAAALARAYGVPPVAVRDGLRAFVPDPHRIADVAVGRRGAVRRRLQGDQPARRGRLAAGVRARRLGRRRPAQGRRRRRPGQRRGRPAAGGGADRRRPRPHRRGPGATRARCPRRRRARHGHWSHGRRRRRGRRPGGPR